jgi:hypothetical protein
MQDAVSCRLAVAATLHVPRRGGGKIAFNFPIRSAISSSQQTHPPSRRPVLAKHSVTGSPKATTTRVARKPRARRGDRCTPLRMCHPGPAHPSQSSPTASNAP